jgi:hypothetical protein
MRLHLATRPLPSGPWAVAPEPSRSRSFSEVLGVRFPETSPPGAPTPPTAREAAGGPALIRRLLGGAIGAEDRVDALLAAAARGKTFSPGELLALQSITFRYAQTVEVVSRVADRLVGTVKQTMSTQV